MKNPVIICLLLASLAGCNAAQEARIVTVTQAAVADGQLFCQAAGTLYQAGTIKVTGQTAQTVASACAALAVAGQAIAGAVPVAASQGQQAMLAQISN